MMTNFQIRETNHDDQEWIAQLLRNHWGSEKIVTRNQIHLAEKLPGWLAIREGAPAGLVLYHIDCQECEIVLLESLASRLGVGTALIDAVTKIAVKRGCKRLWLITTNDNLAAVRFYQLRGFTLAAVHRNAVDEARKIKPEIPLSGMDGIPVRDEIEMEMLL